MDSSRRRTVENTKPTRSDESLREFEARRPAAVAELKQNATGPWVRVALPSNGGAVTHLPLRRREVFEAHLRSIIAMSSETSAESPNLLPTADLAGENPASKLMERKDEFMHGSVYIKNWGYNVDKTGTNPYNH